MTTAKTFAVAGVSTLAGKTKIRFANDTMRIKILQKNGHTDVELLSLPHAMTKGEIAQYMIETGFGADSEATQAAIQYVVKKNPVAKQATVVAVEATSVAV